MAGEVPTESEQRAHEVICYQFGRYLTIAMDLEKALFRQTFRVSGENDTSSGVEITTSISMFR